MANWPTDEELEEIYRKGSEKHSFPYDPKAWEDMSALLDKKKKNKILFFLFFGILLLTLSVFYFGIGNTDSESNTTELKDSVEYVHTSKKESTSNGIDPVVATHSNESKIKTISVDLGSSQSIEERSTKANSFSQKQTILKKILSDTHPIAQVSESNTTPKLSEDSQTQFNGEASYGIVVQNSNLDPIRTSETKRTVSINAIYKSKISSFLTDQFIDLPESGPIVPFSIDQQSSANGFSINVLIGAESSWTPTGEFSRIDYAIGLGVNKRINNKLGFSIGSNYIRDLYIANQGDYKATSSFWGQNEEPNYTSADCKMIEINTGLSYHFNGWGSSGVAVHVGLLSNFMLSEKYDYHFAEESNNFSSSWATSNATWLNAINFSPSYNFNYGAKGNIEIGPYFKIPLSGIGHGDIMLSSFGIKGSFRIH